MRRFAALLPGIMLVGLSIALLCGAAAGNRRNQPRAAAGKDARSTMDPKAPTLIAHRGMHHVLPENSKEAMVAAWKAGIEWCECDVYLSADGVCVLMHDATLDRTTEAKGKLAERTWAELRQVRLKNANGSLSKFCIPSLEDVLGAMPEDCAMLIEIKPADDEKLVKEALRLSKGRRVVIQSFDAADVRHAIRLGEGVPTAFLTGKAEGLDLALTGEWPAINVEQKLLTPDLARRAKQAGKSLGVWTVDEPEDIRRVLSVGVERIITDYPKWVREITHGR